MFTFLSSGVSLLMANVSPGHKAPCVSPPLIGHLLLSWPLIGQSPLIGLMWARARDGSCYLSSLFPGRAHITPSRQININHCRVSVHNIYIARTNSGLSQSDLINSWHKTGPAKPHTPGLLDSAQQRRWSLRAGVFNIYIDSTMLRSVTRLDIGSLSGC